MKIVLIGPPGSGKGTQGRFISKKYHIPQISAGDILRINIDSNNTVGKFIQNIVEQGKLVPDDIICNLISERIKENDCKNGFLLDGFPRTVNQANYMLKKKIKIDYVFEFLIPYELILNRILGRQIHISSGRIYHSKFNPPINLGKDDITGESLVTRKDDTLKTIQKRLEEYKKQSSLLISYYLKKEKLGHLKYFKINGKKILSDIQKEIQLILE